MEAGAERNVGPVSEGQLAKVIQFPAAPRSCFTCSHWRGIEQGAVSWCEVYSQTIDSEAYEAEECFTYEHVEEGSQPLLDEDPRGNEEPE